MSQLTRPSCLPYSLITDPGKYQKQQLSAVQQERLGSWFKQRDNKWVTAWAYVLCTSLLRLPFSLLDAAMWAVIVYWTTGLTPEASRCL